MRTTISMDSDLVREAKQRALAHGQTFSQVVEAAVRESLLRPVRRHERRQDLPTAPGAPLPGVDLDDSAALYDLMDARP